MVKNVNYKGKVENELSFGAKRINGKKTFVETGEIEYDNLFLNLLANGRYQKWALAISILLFIGSIVGIVLICMGKISFPLDITIGITLLSGIASYVFYKLLA